MIVSQLCFDELIRSMMEDDVKPAAKAAYDYAMKNDYCGQMERNGYVLIEHARPMSNAKTKNS